MFCSYLLMLVLRSLQLPAHAGSSLADFSTLKMKAIRSSETSVQSTTSTRRHTLEDGILHSHRRENLKSYKNPQLYLHFSQHHIYELSCGQEGICPPVCVVR
jgi:hypothetical protein